MNTEHSILELGYALNTFYLLVSGAFVMWMTAGFAMLEAGLVRAKNTTEILTKNVGLFAIACVMYLLCGYSIMYSDGGAWLPGFKAFGSADTTFAAMTAVEGAVNRSELANFFFQVVFVATAMSIVSGAVAERMKLWSFFAFCVALTGFIYPVQAYWKWGGGWLEQIGFIDYAGSGVVHLCGASAALAGVLVLGPRQGKYGQIGEVRAMPGANLPLATLGMFILWLGWFGFNGGSQLRIDHLQDANAVARVFVNTNMAAAAAALSAMALARLWLGKTDLTMVLNGALAGLVTVTAEPLAPTPLLAVVMGLSAGVLIVPAIVYIDRWFKIDDPVGAISVHGLMGIWGLLWVAVSNEEASFLSQLIGVVAIFLWVFSISLGVWLVLKYTVGIRVNSSEEYEGSDIYECGMEAYPEFMKSRE